MATPRPDDGLRLVEAIPAYLAACTVEGKSPDAYAETLRRFQGICVAGNLPFWMGDFRAPHIYAFLQVVADSGVSLGSSGRARAWSRSRS